MSIFCLFATRFSSLGTPLLITTFSWTNCLIVASINVKQKIGSVSYLKNRKQYVCMGYRKALTLALYYFLYISMMLNLLQTLFMLRADDINLLVSDKSLKMSVAVLNNDWLARLEEWFQANKLTINLAKTKFILFCSRQRLANIFPTRLENEFSLKLGSKIDKVSHRKFLGLVLDENLTWSFHIDSISRKISMSIGILYRARHYLSLDIWKILIIVLFTYVIWHFHLAGADPYGLPSFTEICQNFHDKK